MKLFSKTLCILLSALMMLYLIPDDVYIIRSSAEDVLVSVDDTLSEDAAAVTAVGEVISKRTASSKTIRMSDGSYRLVQYANDVHYEDDGEWLEYDNSLSISSASSSGAVTMGGITDGEPAAFQAASNPGGLKFGQSTTGNVMSFSEGDKRLAMSIHGAKTTTITPQTNAVDIVPLDKFEEIVTIENYSSSVLYSNVFDNAHIRYTAAGNRVKEDIIVYKAANEYVYDFTFTLTGLEAELLADGSIIFTDEQTDEMMYYIPVGYMYDNNGAESASVSYSLAETATGCTVTVTADAEWINDADRAFPVVIDPTIVRDNGFLYTYNEIRDTDAYGEEESGLVYQSQFIRVGMVDNHHYSGYISLYAEEGEDEVGFVLPKASVVTSAKLFLDVTSCSTTTVYMHAITEDWDYKASTWIAPDVSENIVDYQIISSASQNCVFDFTSIAQKWGKSSNEPTSFYRGFRLSCDTDGTGYVKFASLNNTQSGTTKPYFVISYRDTKGIESRWTYNSQSAGNAGTGSVNLFTGNLVFAHDDITTNGEILPITVPSNYTYLRVAMAWIKKNAASSENCDLSSAGSSDNYQPLANLKLEVFEGTGTSGTRVAYSDASNNNLELLQFDVNGGGTYTIRITNQSYNNSSITGNQYISLAWY